MKNSLAEKISEKAEQQIATYVVNNFNSNRRSYLGAYPPENTYDELSSYVASINFINLNKNYMINQLDKNARIPLSRSEIIEEIDNTIEYIKGQYYDVYNQMLEMGEDDLDLPNYDCEIVNVNGLTKDDSL